MTLTFEEFFPDFINFLLSHHIVALFSSLVFILVAFLNPRIGDFSLRKIAYVPIALLLLTISDSIDWTLGNTGSPAIYPVYIRLVFSLLGFCLRPAIGAVALVVLLPKNLEKKKWLFFMPLVANTIVYATCLTGKGFIQITPDNSFSKPYDELLFFAYFAYWTGAFYAINILYYLIIGIKARRLYSAIPLAFGIIVGLCGFIFESLLDVNGIGTACCSISILVLVIFLLLKYMKIDPLTGIDNRQSFYSAIGKQKSVDAIISIDMNNLKEVNDKKGHFAGDQALITIADKLVSACDGSKFVAFRMGGDEFSVLASHVSEDAVRAFIEKIDNAINHETDINVAIGYAYRQDKDETIESIMKRSDAFMYKMKRIMKM